MKLKDLIVISGLVLLLSFGGRALIYDKDIPGNVQVLILSIITAGMAHDPLTEAAKRLSAPKEEPKHDA